MFLVARDLYEMFVLCRGKHATRSSTVGIEVKYEYIVHWSTNISCTGALRLGKFPGNWH